MKKITRAVLLSILLLCSISIIDTKEASAVSGCVINTYDNKVFPYYPYSSSFVNLTYRDITWKNGVNRTLDNGVQVESLFRILLGYSTTRYTYTYYTY